MFQFLTKACFLNGAKLSSSSFLCSRVDVSPNAMQLEFNKNALYEITRWNISTPVPQVDQRSLKLCLPEWFISVYFNRLLHESILGLMRALVYKRTFCTISLIKKATALNFRYSRLSFWCTSRQLVKYTFGSRSNIFTQSCHLCWLICVVRILFLIVDH